ncbi:alpha/beta fold hydrolase [Pseudonocardia sp. CA-107938]|uniref:alpha/beta fold hydrolase n=1 Tax=Pseudonocardia sp. CA-107938 TaxID=3240021 RepID=UPI003D8E4DE1
MGVTVPGADGAPLNVEIDGPVTAPVTVVLAHGWTLDGRTWGPVARSLRGGRAPVRVVRPDHRGHGRSAVVDPTTMTIEQLADDLAEVIAVTAPAGPLVLAGHSMGGMTLMAMAERHPEVFDRVHGIALVSTAAGGLAAATLGLPPWAAAIFQGGERALYGSARWKAGERLGNARLLSPALSWLLLGERPTAEARRITVETVAACRPATVAGFRPTLNAHERDAALATFAEIPTAVLVGTKDRLTPVAASRRIHDALPSAELAVLPGAGHMLPVERVPEVVGRIGALVHGATGGMRATA